MLIGRLLKAKIVMPDGVLVANEEGVPQGSPLSPLLSNIVLDELDWELDRPCESSAEPSSATGRDETLVPR